uniref:Uncharacterized protein n=1 Tax=Octopus bimaculoides TaxID=37653 RepID=A0A0L8H0R7_OCTBM
MVQRMALEQLTAQCEASAAHVPTCKTQQQTARSVTCSNCIFIEKLLSIFRYILSFEKKKKNLISEFRIKDRTLLRCAIN